MQHYILLTNLLAHLCLFVENILYILIGIKLQSLSVSILHFYVFFLRGLLFVFNFAIITDLMLWKLKIFNLTAPNSCVGTSFVTFQHPSVLATAYVHVCVFLYMN